MFERYPIANDTPYKSAFVDFILSQPWHWFITIPVGMCSNEDDVLRRLRLIEGKFCGDYVANRHNRLPDDERFVMAVAFEGTVKTGTRHAHVLAYVPSPKKRAISHLMMSSLFPFEFRFNWTKLDASRTGSRYDPERAHRDHPLNDLHIAPANQARAVYTAKNVRQDHVPWSRFEFVTPPKFEKFDNENLQELRKVNCQKRRNLGIA